MGGTESGKCHVFGAASLWHGNGVRAGPGNGMGGYEDRQTDHAGLRSEEGR